MAPLFAIRDGAQVHPGAAELYDLRNDPHELHDLVAQQRVAAVWAETAS